MLKYFRTPKTEPARRGSEFQYPDELAEYFCVDRSELAQALRDQSRLDELAGLQKLTESQGYDEDEFAQLLEDTSDNPDALAEALGFSNPGSLLRLWATKAPGSSPRP